MNSGASPILLKTDGRQINAPFNSNFLQQNTHSNIIIIIFYKHVQNSITFNSFFHYTFPRILSSFNKYCFLTHTQC